MYVNEKKRKSSLLVKITKLAMLLLLVLVLVVFLIYQFLKTDAEEVKTPSKRTVKKEATKSQSPPQPRPDSPTFSNSTSFHSTADLNKRLGKFSEKDDAGVVDSFLAQPNANPNELVDDESPVMCAASRWLLSVLQKFKDIDFEVKNKEGSTVMHAFTKNDPKTEEEQQRAKETLKYLLKKGGKVDVVSDGYTPLMTAIKNGNEKIAKILIENGACVDGPAADGKFDVNPLMLAVRKHDFSTTKHLLDEGAKLLFHNTVGFSALQEAVSCGFVEGLRLFLDWLKDFKGQDCKNAVVPPGQTKYSGASLLHLAVINQQLEVAKLLVLHYKVNRDLIDASGKTAAIYAQNRVEELEKQSLTSPETIKLRIRAKSIVELLKADEAQTLQYQKETEAAYRQQRADRSRSKRIQNETSQKEKTLQKLKDEGIF